MGCRLCEHPSCTKDDSADIRGIMRRTAVGNFKGAKKRWAESPADLSKLQQFEACCICGVENGDAVKIRDVVAFITGNKPL